MARKAGIAAILAAVLLQLCSAQFADDLQRFEELCLGESVFHCADGGCVTMDQYCDGRADCKDESDESFCPGIHYRPNAFACSAALEFPCNDGARCVPYSWLCNGVNDCEDGSDEANCTGKLSENKPSSPCKGFECNDGGCISWLWVCDGSVDCKDKSDEHNETLCRELKPGLSRFDILNCRDNWDSESKRLTLRYACDDRSFCLTEGQMCDGVVDCRDGGDEGKFCDQWPNMCANNNCSAEATCKRQRGGPSCACDPAHAYSYQTRECADLDECADAMPRCSHKCTNVHPFRCSCDEGYTKDRFSYLCFAPDPEAMLFFSTPNEIRYLKLKSRQQVTVVTGLKKAHGVTYDGEHLYWVESASGHQAIVRARLSNIAETKQTIVAMGLEDPGDVAVDWLAKLVYFSDAERGHIAACYVDGGMCTIVNATTWHPRHVTLYPQRGEMFWADFHDRSVIMRANMDGSESRVFVDNLKHFPSGLTLDVPNERLYYVDGMVVVVTRLDGGGSYILVESAFHHPYALAVFENTVYWSDWTSNTLQACDKINPVPARRKLITAMDIPIMGLHLYHPLLMQPKAHACQSTNCSDMCLLSGPGRACVCPEGRKRVNENLCAPSSFLELPQFLVVGGGNVFTRIKHNSLGNPEIRAVKLNIGRVQAMAFNNFKRNLYIYDGQRKVINFINMNNFSDGVALILEHQGLDNVVDMDYDYVSDVLYFADAGRRVVEALSLRTSSRAVVYRFTDETPISLCVIPEYGLLMVAVVNGENQRDITINSMGLDGNGRHYVAQSGMKGPHIRLRYHKGMDLVFISDEGTGNIDYVHPTGTGRESYRQLSTTVTSLAVSAGSVFWTDRRTPRLFWAGAHETAQTVRRVEMKIFPNHTQLHLQSTIPFPDLRSALMQHPCFKMNPCSHVCVQITHPSPSQVPLNSFLGFSCLCPAGMMLVNRSTCEPLRSCHEGQVYCHGDNSCAEGKRCDGVATCKGGEDEMDCKDPKNKCSPNEQLCNGVCISKNSVCKNASEPAVVATTNETCDRDLFACAGTDICLPRWQLCDAAPDCPDGGDEAARLCDELQCRADEFQCTSRSCIWKTWRCDGYPDCADGSDEANCANRSCSRGLYRCGSGECIELKKRCDKQQDCLDYSDEEQCDDDDGIEEEEIPECEENEYTCQLNRSVCLPLSARCNTKIDCPGGTDEIDCNYACRGNTALFQCEQEHYCISRHKLCDGHQDCLDGSDEISWNCPKGVQPLPPRPAAPASECPRGYRCASGQCVEWRAVCDQRPDCFDGSDEGAACFTTCENSTCARACQPTPYGGVCQCDAGYEPDARSGRCVDADECSRDQCSQRCENLPGSFVCSCFHGFTLTNDRRHCKAVKGHLSILYVNGNTVKTAEDDGSGAAYYRHSAPIQDIDFHVRDQKLYSISTVAGQLIEVNASHEIEVITNIGVPTRVALDWITGNVYFVDSSPQAQTVRVCNFQKRRCAKLQQLPSDANITAFVVDPANNRMFYCINQYTDSMIWSSTLSGGATSDLGPSEAGCQGLAADSFRRRLYVAERRPARVSMLSYEGDRRKTVLSAKVRLQAPHRIALFEDHLYYLVASTFHIGRCPLFGSQQCSPYVYRVFDAGAFRLRHESAQRADVLDLCAGYRCAGVCVIEETPQCICEDGALTKDGSDCAPLDKKDMPLFNGYTLAELERPNYSAALLLSLLVISIMILMSLSVYFFVYKPRRDAVNPMPVRFLNVTPKEGAAGPGAPAADHVTTEATVAFGEPQASRHEFVNPLQYVRNKLRQSFSRGPRVVLATLTWHDGYPTLDADSTTDTESEPDSRDTKGFISD